MYCDYYLTIQLTGDSVPILAEKDPACKHNITWARLDKIKVLPLVIILVTMQWWWWSACDGSTSFGLAGKVEKAQQAKIKPKRSYPWRWWRCGSMHEEMYWRSRLSAAFRTGWACLMAGVILQVGSMHVQWVTFPIFGYVMAVTVVGESTVGKAMQDALAIATGTLQVIKRRIIGPMHI